MGRPTLGAPDVLQGGEWQAVNGVQRWVCRPTPTPPATVDQMQVSLLIACPTCRAKVDQTCRTTGGNPTAPHQSRLAPRLCSCGALLAWKKQLCKPCAVVARRETYRLRERRNPTRARRRAA